MTSMGERDVLYSPFIFSLNPLSFVFFKIIVFKYSEYTHELVNTMKHNFTNENRRRLFPK